MSTSTPVRAKETFTDQELRRVAEGPIPAHIAIIPDGNRRWARDREDEGQAGHWQGADSLLDIVKGARELGVRVLTVYGFSTENWRRQDEEVEELLDVVETYLKEQRDAMVENGVRLKAIGNLERFPVSLREALSTTIAATAACNEIELVLALNYGGRDELRRAVQKILDRQQSGDLSSTEVTEHLISECLDTAEWTDPDLLIRTSGEMRISNFLLWQLSYTEIYVSPVLWPEFRPIHLLDAVQAYQERQRREGT